MNSNQDIPEIDKLNWHCIRDHNVKGKCSTECLLRSAFDLFGKKYTLSIIRLLLLNGTLRFNEIEEEIKGSPKTITKRLRDLEQQGLIHREAYNEIPMRVEYSLTSAGLGLDTVFETITDWIRTYIKKEAV